MQEHIDFNDRALIGWIRLKGPLQQFGQHVCAEIHENEAGIDGVRSFAQIEMHGSSVSGDIERFDRNVGVHFGAVAGGYSGEFLHDTSHPANGHFPLSGAVADEVIEKTAILEESGIVRMCEQTDFAIRKDNAAEQIVLKIAFDGQTERFLNETAPCLAREIILFKPLREFLFSSERLEHRIPELVGEDAGQGVKLFQLFELGIVACEFAE